MVHDVVIAQVLQHPRGLDNVTLCVELLPQIVRAKILVKLGALQQQVQHVTNPVRVLLAHRQNLNGLTRARIHRGVVAQFTRALEVLEPLLPHVVGEFTKVTHRRYIQHLVVPLQLWRAGRGLKHLALSLVLARCVPN